MIVCQWHLDVTYGRQTEAVKIMKAWLEEGRKTSEFRLAASHRLLVGHVGMSPSHIVAEHVFESLADYEAAVGGMGAPQFKHFSDALAPLIVAGSQHWEILRIVE